MKNINKKIISNKSKHVKTEKKLTDLSGKISQAWTKGYKFLSHKMCFAWEDPSR